MLHYVSTTEDGSKCKFTVFRIPETHHKMRIPKRVMTYIVLSVYLRTINHR